MESEAGAKWQGRPAGSPLESNNSHASGQPDLGKKGHGSPCPYICLWDWDGGKGFHRLEAFATGPLPPSPTNSAFKLIVVHLHGAEAAAHGALVFFGLGEVPVAPGFGGVDGQLDLGVPVQGPAGLGHL